MKQAEFALVFRTGLVLGVLALGCTPPAASQAAPAAEATAVESKPKPEAKSPADEDDVDDLIKKLKGEALDPAKRPEQKPPKPAKVRLPKYFDQLGLTDEQKVKMARVAKPYDDKIAEVQQKLDDARRVRIGTAGLIIGYTNAIKKLNNRRLKALEELLTDDQCNKLKKLRSEN
jgi:hypothetical protein